MKTLLNKKIIAIIFFIVLVTTPFTAFAADMWAETPDLNDDSEISSLAKESATFKSKAPAINLWTETPDLLAETENHGVAIDTESRIVSNFNPEMYAETPDLNRAVGNQHGKTLEVILIASGK